MPPDPTWDERLDDLGFYRLIIRQVDMGINPPG